MMVSLPDSRDSGPVAARTPFLLRGVRGVIYGVIAGLCIGVLRAQSIGSTIIYSACIAFMCWLLIDTGRSLLSLWLERRFGRTTAGWPGWRWMLPLVVVCSSLAFLAGSKLGDLLTGGRTPIFALTAAPRQSLAALLEVVVPAVVITFLFYARSAIADQEAAAQVARRQAAESRLRLLESQLEPHMFFNTLANLHVLIGLDPPRAQAMLDQLIAFLRATLSASRVTEHPLKAELARTRDYLALMQVRMEDRLRVRFDLPAELAEIPVPPLLLQPLVENAVKHGLEPSVSGGRIEVAARREGTVLIITVRDTGVGPANGSVGTGTGFGLEQVRERLATHYGPAASLSLTSAEDAEGGMLAVIRLPVAAAAILSGRVDSPKPLPGSSS